MVEEDFIRAEFHCGWRVIEKPDGYTFINLKGQVMPHRFWKVSDFDEETGVAQVEFMTFGRGCVTFDCRVLPLPFDGEIVDQLTEEKGVYKIHLPHKRTIYRVYNSKTKKLEDKFADWKIVKTFKDGGKLVGVAPKSYRFVDKGGKLSVLSYREWMDTSLGTLVTHNGVAWAPIQEGKLNTFEMYFLDHQDEKGMYFKGEKGEFLLTKDGEFTPFQFEDVNLQRLNKNSTPTHKNPDVLLHSKNITVYKKKPSQKYHTVALDVEGQRYALEELGEDLKVLGAYKNSETKQVYLFGRHDGEDAIWWNLDEKGNVEKLSDVCDYGYDKYGTIVSQGKTVIFKARDIENQSAKTL